MKVTFDDLKTYGLYDNLPAKLKELTDGKYYVFYYKALDEKGKLELYSDDIVAEINISLYRQLGNLRLKGLIKPGDDAKVGYFSFDSFESRCGIFYTFLNSYCDKASIENFYSYCVKNDVTANYSISTSAINDIFDRSGFERVISFFTTDTRISSVMRVYDICNTWTQNKFNKSLYGGYIKKIVQLIAYEAGVLPEKNGQMRFMVIGEKAILTSAETEQLEKAKLLLRSVVPPVEIYKQTGWFFNLKDGKWRHNTTDVGSYISTDCLVSINGAMVYSPPGSRLNVAQAEKLMQDPETLYKIGYAGHISDVLKHPTLADRYPAIGNLPLVFRDNPKVDFGNFYSSPNSLGGFLMIDGNSKNVNLVSVMLHETQHIIQRIEGFGEGGNEFLASFVVSVGGQNLRRIFYAVKNLQNTLFSKIDNPDKFSKLKGIVADLTVSDAETEQLKNKLMEYCETFDSFQAGIDNFSLYTTFYLSSAKQLVSGEMIEYLADITDNNVYDLTEFMNDGLEKADLFSQSLLMKGYTQEDVGRILFNAYEDLMGEVESRSVQHRMMLEDKYTNYFYLYDWENSPERKIAVINSEYVEVDTEKLLGAVERISDGYILHFKECFTVEPFLHELGHIIDDILCEDEANAVKIDEAFSKVHTKKDRSEFFVDCFLGYVRDLRLDNKIPLDLAMNYDLKRNDIIDEMLNEVFGIDEIEKGMEDYLEELAKP